MTPRSSKDSSDGYTAQKMKSSIGGREGWMWKQEERARESRGLLTVTVSPEPTFITESGSLRKESLNSLRSFRVHMEAAAMGG